MTVVRDEKGYWDVVDDKGVVVARGFATEEMAWYWIDKQDEERFKLSDPSRGN